MKQVLFVVALMFVVSAHAQDAKTLYNEGIKLKGEKKSAEALEKFKKAVSLKADYYDAIYEIGWCQNDLKQYPLAMSNLRKARIGWPTIPKVHFELGYAFEKQGLTDSAKASYKRCLELKPDYSLAHKQLGTIAYDKNLYPEGLMHFDNYIKYAGSAGKEITDYLFWYRKGFMENAEKKYTMAKESLQKSLLYKKDYINTYLELGFACTKQKEDDNAINWFTQAMTIDPKSHIPYNGIAEVYRD
ncbi:MAG: tetratricopeptide repeat protein, partial [Dinghuibacter sp.]|nr:tetratricopeptide repeat protein [Dinghuibacter sp.]